jgi:2-keto-4-pentenoate hydratase
LALLDPMMLADGAKVPHANYFVPRVEPELAFVLGKPLKDPDMKRMARASGKMLNAFSACDLTRRQP